MDIADFDNADQRFENDLDDEIETTVSILLGNLESFFGDSGQLDQARELVAEVQAAGDVSIFNGNPLFFGAPDAGADLINVFVTSEVVNRSTDFHGDYNWDLFFNKEKSEDRFLTLRSGYRKSVREREAIGQGFQVLVQSAAGSNSTVEDNSNFNITQSDLDGTSGRNAGAEFLNNLIEILDGNGVQELDTENTAEFDARSNFDAEIDVTGLYGALDFHWDKWLTASLGYRFETERVRGGRSFPAVNVDNRAAEFASQERVSGLAPDNFDVTLEEFLNDPTLLDSSRDEDFNLFSLNVEGKFFQDKLKLGFSASETTARPSIRQFLGFNQFVPEESIIFVGSPNVRTATIENLDFNLEWAITDRLDLSVSRFYKDIEDATVSFFAGSSNGIASIRTVDPLIAEAESSVLDDDFLTGQINGWELTLDWRLNDYWTLSGNATIIDRSELNFGDTFIDPARSAEEVNFTTDFPDQPNNIYNVILGYNNNEWGLSANLIYNFTGERLRYLPASGQDGQIEIFRNARSQLDFNISKAFALRGADYNLKFSVNNLLDEADIQFERLTGGSINSPTNPRQVSNSGRTYGLELTVSF